MSNTNASPNKSPEVSPVVSSLAAEPVTSTAVEAQIDQIFSECFELRSADLQPSTRLYEDLGLDSLDAVDLVIAFQKRFNVKPHRDEIVDIRTVADVYALAHKYASGSPTLGSVR